MRWVKYDVNAQDNAKSDDAKIKENILWKGMSKATVRVSLGEPGAVNRFYSTRNGQTVQWFYDNKSLYFENGTLVSWKDN